MEVNVRFKNLHTCEPFEVAHTYAKNICKRYGLENQAEDLAQDILLNFYLSLVNHLIGLFKKGWVYRPYLCRLTPKRDNCSGVVAIQLNLEYNASEWCGSNRMIEPDDFYNHTETFEYLGEVVWPTTHSE